MVINHTQPYSECMTNRLYHLLFFLYRDTTTIYLKPFGFDSIITSGNFFINKLVSIVHRHSERHLKKNILYLKN